MPTIASFSSLFNLQSKSINVNLGHLSPKYQGYSLTFCPNFAHFHHFSICNQNQSISILVNFRQNTKAIAYFLPKIGSFSSLFNVQSKSINFNFGHFSPKYKGYSLTICPKLAHFHHCSICNQNQSISIWVICRQTTKAILLLFAQNCLIFITFQSAIKINQFQFGQFSPKYQGYSLTFCPKLAHFHHFSMCNQNQSISISVIFRQNTKAIALLFAQNWLIFISFQCAIKINQFQFRHLSPKYQGYSLTFCRKLAHCQHFSICNQHQSISIWVICRQNTKAIALLFAQNWLIVNTFQSAIKINQFQFRSFSPKYQGYSLTICPKLAHFHHCSICNQNQSISIWVICRQNTKAIALLFAQNWLIFISFQCAIKINQFQCRSFFAKIPRL